MDDEPRIVTESEFRARSGELLDEVAQTHQPIAIERNGKVFVRLVPEAEVPDAAPPAEDKLHPLFGFMKGKIKIHGDIMSTGEVADAELGKLFSDDRA